MGFRCFLPSFSFCSSLFSFFRYCREHHRAAGWPAIGIGLGSDKRGAVISRRLGNSTVNIQDLNQKPCRPTIFETWNCLSGKDAAGFMGGPKSKTKSKAGYTSDYDEIVLSKKRVFGLPPQTPTDSISSAQHPKVEGERMRRFARPACRVWTSYFACVIFY